MSGVGDWFGSVWETLTGYSHEIEQFILASSESWWVYPSIYALSVIDGIFPVVPSESVLIAAATASVHTGSPWLPGVWLAGAAGAWCGDQLAYLIGRRIDVRKLRIVRTKRGVATLDWAEHALEHRGTTFIIAARFVPMGRVAVNLSAGALRYPHRRFMGVDAIAAIIWATWSVGLGLFAGSVFESNLLVSVSVGVIGGVALGLLVDKILARFGIAPPELPDLAADIQEDSLDNAKD